MKVNPPRAASPIYRSRAEKEKRKKGKLLPEGISKGLGLGLAAWTTSIRGWGDVDSGVLPRRRMQLNGFLGVMLLLDVDDAFLGDLRVLRKAGERDSKRTGDVLLRSSIIGEEPAELLRVP